jgi:hypothetical protein
MNKLPPETIAMRRGIVVTLVAFVVGFVVMLATLAWVIMRFVTPEARWWDVLHTSINVIMISVVFGGLGSAALASWVLSRYHYHDRNGGELPADSPVDHRPSQGLQRASGYLALPETRSGYYAWSRGQERARELANRVMAEEINARVPGISGSATAVRR